MKKMKKKRTNNRAAAVQTGWCQVRISAELATAVDQLAAGEKSRIVREALTAACREARIPLRPRVDPAQLALPATITRAAKTIGAKVRALKPPAKSRGKFST